MSETQLGVKAQSGELAIASRICHRPFTSPSTEDATVVIIS
ncbi:MAG TPA: hypothetical protein VE944_21330 [Nostoc sp.]|nr:hypothetical protein [Nostoc sp.]HYX16843.1 hypothetical protein [Nostoc sp.]